MAKYQTTVEVEAYEITAVSPGVKPRDISADIRMYTLTCGFREPYTYYFDAGTVPQVGDYMVETDKDFDNGETRCRHFPRAEFLAIYRESTP